MTDLQGHLNNEFKEAIVNLEKHADIANEEMGAVKNDISWIKGILGRHESMLWFIISGVIIVIALQILFKLYK